MAKKLDFPDHYFNKDIVKKNIKVLIYRRNNLSSSNFKQTPDNNYYFSENYVDNGINSRVKIIINNNNISDLFCSKFQNNFKVKGKANSFGIIITFKISDMILDTEGKHHIKISGINNSIKYNYDCEIDFSIFNCRSGSKKNTNDNRSLKINSTSIRTNVEIPNSIKWAASHPFSGGKASPK